MDLHKRSDAKNRWIEEKVVIPECVSYVVYVEVVEKIRELCDEVNLNWNELQNKLLLAKNKYGTEHNT